MRHIGVLLPVVFAFLVGAAPASAWTWPVEGPVMQPFSFGGDPYAGGQHRGIDVGAASNAPVRAPAAGLVSFAGSVPRGGLTVTIRTDDGYAVTLVHLGTVAVGRGQPGPRGRRRRGRRADRGGRATVALRASGDTSRGRRARIRRPADDPACTAGRVERAGGRSPGRRGCGRRSRRRTPAEQPSSGAGPEHPSAAAQTEASSEEGATAASSASSELPPSPSPERARPVPAPARRRRRRRSRAGTVVSAQDGGERTPDADGAALEPAAAAAAEAGSSPRRADARGCPDVDAGPDVPRSRPPRGAGRREKPRNRVPVTGFRGRRA